jgi:hypothetical protein
VQLRFPHDMAKVEKMDLSMLQKVQKVIDLEENIRVKLRPFFKEHFPENIEHLDKFDIFQLQEIEVRVNQNLAFKEKVRRLEKGVQLIKLIVIAAGIYSSRILTSRL